MLRVLVTGAAGFLGWNLCRAWTHTFALTAAWHRTPVDLDGVSPRQADLTDSAAVGALLDAARPEVVVHTAALAKPNACEQDPDASFRINVAATRALAGACRARGARLVFTSTDLVFDGDHAPYDETAAPAPLNVYGRHKAEAEAGVLAAAPGALVCRLPLLFGAAAPHAESFIQPWLAALRAGRDLALFEDEFRTATGAAAVADGLRLAIEARAAGLLHLGGRERMSRYAFGLLLADAFGLSPEPIRRVRRADVPMAAPRARDVSLDSRKAYAFGYDPAPVAAQLRALTAGPACDQISSSRS
jgi:dTDP-4-dehydrorhamnose reductase